MKKLKRGWGDAITLNFLMLCRAPVLPPLAPASSLRLTFDALCLRFSTLTLFTVRLTGLFKYWPLPITVASRVIGWAGFNAKETEMNKPFTLVAVVVLSLVSLLQLLRLLLGWEITINGITIPLWASGLAFVVAAGLAAMVWRERRS